MKFELKRILSYFFILFLIIFFLEGNNQVNLELPIYFYLGLVMSVSGFLLIYLQIKMRKIFIILDTKLKQEQYKDEKGINPIKGRKFKASYKYWLLKNVKKNNINTIYKNYFKYKSQYHCIFGYFIIIPIIIVWVFANMYMTSAEALVVSFSIVGCLILLCITLEKREDKIQYKYLDSELKQIIFEESTGYSPLYNGKYTFKYKVWLILND